MLSIGRGGPTDCGLVHVHGLSNNSADGEVYAATRAGIYRLGAGGPERVSGRVQDTMGFTIVGPNRFLGSGHPGPAEPGPVNAGLIRSDDGGASWTPASLAGQADFHTLAAAKDTVYGWDSASRTVLRSDDTGRTWARGAVLDEAGALAIDPDNVRRLVATTAMGLLASTDGGTSFALHPVQPPRPLLLVDHAPRTGGGGETVLAGVDRTGTAWTFDGAVWSRGTSPAGPPEAFAVLGPDRYVVATDQGIRSTEDAGRTWTLVAAMG